MQNLLMLTTRVSPLSARSPVFFVLTIIAIVGYIMLLASRRSGYFLIVLSITTIFFTCFKYGMNSLKLTELFLGGKYNPLGFGFMAESFIYLINPLVTGLILIGAWSTDPHELREEKAKIPVIYKISSILGSAIFLTLFVGGAASYYGFKSTREPGLFVFTVVLGAVLAALQMFCLLACFRKDSKARKGLLITGLVFTAIATVFLLAAFVAFLVDVLN